MTDPLSDLANALDNSTPSRNTNRHAPPTDCPTCGGDKFVLVRFRSPVQSVGMADHNIEPRRDQFQEEYAPCPDCHNIEIRYHGFRQMDPATVREALRQ